MRIWSDFAPHLRIDRWVVSGGSWGSTVAISYAQTHPESCLGVNVACVLLNRRKDIDWWFYGVRTIFPELWEQFAALLSREERENLVDAYYHRIMNTDPEVSQPAAVALYLYEEGFMHFEAPGKTSRSHASAQLRSHLHSLCEARLFS